MEGLQMARYHKRHYEDIALALHGGMVSLALRNDNNWLYNRCILACAERIADILQKDSPRFNRSKFIEAVKHG